MKQENKGILISVDCVDKDLKRMFIEKLTERIQSGGFLRKGSVIKNLLPLSAALSRDIHQIISFHKNKKLKDLSRFFLNMSSHYQSIEENIIPFLQKENIVISDYTSFSHIIFESHIKRLKIKESKFLKKWLMKDIPNVITFYIKSSYQAEFLHIWNIHDQFKEKKELNYRDTQIIKKMHKKFINVYEKSKPRIIMDVKDIDEIVSIAYTHVQQKLIMIESSSKLL